MTLRRISLNEKSALPTMKTIFMRSRIIIGATGLLVILVITLNYWETSSQNADLARQVDTLEESLKLSAAKQEELEEELGLSKNSYDQCRRDQKEVSAELDTSKKEALVLESQISQQKMKVSQIGASMVNLEKKEKEMEAFVQKQAEQIRELEQRLESKTAALKGAGEQLVQSKTVQETLNLQVKNLKERIGVLERLQLSVANSVQGLAIPNAINQAGALNGSTVSPQRATLQENIKEQSLDAKLPAADEVPSRYQFNAEETVSKEDKVKEILAEPPNVENKVLEVEPVLGEQKIAQLPKINNMEKENVLKPPQLSEDGHVDLNVAKNEGVNGLLDDQRLQEPPPQPANLQDNMEEDQGLALEKDSLNNNEVGEVNNEINVDVAAGGAEDLPGNDKADAAAKHLEEEGGEEDNELLEDEREPALI